MYVCIDKNCDSVLLSISAVRVVVAGEYCPYDYDKSPYYYEERYCYYGCCRNRTSSYSEVCCSSNYNTDSSTSSRSSSSASISVGPVLGGVAGLSILLGLARCCCAAANSSRKKPETVQPSNTAMRTFVVNTTDLSQEGSIIPVHEETVGYAYPSASPPPPYGHYDNVSQKNADLTCSPSQDAKF
ncbi:hypothetical protein ACJMK2_000418 [Sinanodonta woodiana]|uniref:Uncharacterized protein n=1 Tax=Sinanodonta woodiana TaxID=1069815 RepID=A0ABD3XPF1_SINWO